MALIKCKECGKEISDQAKVCPNCGAKTETANKKKINLIAFFCITIIVLGIFLINYFIQINNPIYKYRQEAISLLEEYKQDKNFTTIAELSNQIRKIQKEFDNQYESNKELPYTSFSLNLSTVSTSLYLDSIHKNILTNTEIDKYISQIKQ